MIPQKCAKSNERDRKSNHSPKLGVEQGAFVCAYNLFNAQLGLIAIYFIKLSYMSLSKKKNYIL